MSRLRGTLGWLLPARPYRLAPEIVVELPDLSGSAFVVDATARGVRELTAEH